MVRCIRIRTATRLEQFASSLPHPLPHSARCPLPSNKPAISPSGNSLISARTITMRNVLIRPLLRVSGFRLGGCIQELTHTLLAGLREHVAAGALHNSAERCDAPKCHPETRVAVQDEVVSWIHHGDRDGEPKKIMWVTGPAGTGKTAIMGSVADTCQAKGILGASHFFSSFSGSEDRRFKRHLIPTLAYQLVQHKAMPQDQSSTSSNY